MRTLAGLPLLLTLVCATVLCAQEPGYPRDRQSFGWALSYAPNSSHILIGQARQRRTWTSGLEYTRLLHTSPRLRFDYEGSVLPFFVESDLTVTGTITRLTAGNESFTFSAPEAPFRVIYVDHQPIGNAESSPGISAPVYATYGRQNTYGAALAPLGFRVTGRPRSRMRPSFSLDLGFVVSSRDLPVDLCDQFNYLFSFGPGLQIFATSSTALRLEYLYRHISNAHQGYQNPGIDQGTFRLTLSRFH